LLWLERYREIFSRKIRLCSWMSSCEGVGGE
jgi:hypothetical protein